MKCERKGYQLLSLGSFSNMKYGKMPKKDMEKRMENILCLVDIGLLVTVMNVI